MTSLLPLFRKAAFFLIASLVSLASCAEGDESSCERNSDCDRGYCQEGICRRDCVDSALDCPKRYTCSMIGRCEFEGEIAGSGGFSGASGASGDGGTSGAGQGGDEPGGNTQVGGAGTSPGGSTQGGAGTSPGGSTQGGAGTSPGGSTQGGAGTSGSAQGGDPFGGGGSPGAGLQLDPCFGDGDCSVGLLCRADFKGGQQRCTKSCSTQNDCLGGRRCEQIDGANVCVTGDVGRKCKNADDCNFACLTNQEYCTTSCKTGSDCPNGYACQPVGNPAQYVCAKVAAACDSNANECIAPAACDTSQNLVVSSCTAACNSAADCPQRAAGLAPWTCDGICRRPPDIFGPLPGGSYPTQYACGPGGTTVNLCNDGQHIDFIAFNIPTPPKVNCNDPYTTSGSEKDACVDSCRYEGGCPWGFTCTAVGSMNGGRIGSTCTAAGGPPAQGLPFKRCE